MQENNQPNQTPMTALSPTPELAQPPAPKMSRRAMITLFLCLAVVLTATIVGLFFANRTTLASEVTRVLSGVPNAMDTAAQGGVAYPKTIPATVSSNDKVVVSGGGSFDGTTYCVVGTSTSDSSIVYHIDSKGKKPVQGVCPSIASANPPEAVSGLSVGSIGSKDIGLSWVSAQGATGYTLQCSLNDRFSEGVVETVSATTQGICSNLAPSTKYFIRVQAKNQSAAGPWSSLVDATTSAWSAAPENLSLSVVSKTQINFSWSSVPGALTYVVERATDTSFTKDVAKVRTTKTEGSSTDLKPGTVYYYHVKAVTPQFDEAHAAFSEVVGTLTQR